MKTQGIYCIKNLKNGKIYYGSSLNLDKRLYEHLRLLRLGKHENKHLQNSFSNYGEEFFEFKIIEECPNLNNEELRNLETEYIQKYKTFNQDIGYNFIPGGIGTKNLSCSIEKREKISKSNKGKTAWNYNIPMSEEQKEKLKKIKTEQCGKAIDIYTLNGDFIETIDSVREVNRKYGLSRNAITDCCKGLTNPTKFICLYHGDPLSVVGSKKITKTKEELSKMYREISIKNNNCIVIDVFDSLGNFLETVEGIGETARKYKISESTIRTSLKKQNNCKKYIFKKHDESIEELKPSVKKTLSNCKFIIYKNNEIVYESKFKKDIVEFLSKIYNRIKNKVTNHLKNCSLENPEFKINEHVVKLVIALNNSNIINASRQLNEDLVEGTNISANGEA